MQRLPLTVIAVLLALAPATATDHWPQFRGAQAGVADDDPALPDRWSETENVRWKVAVPGLGWSSPIVWGNPQRISLQAPAATWPMDRLGCRCWT